MSIPSIVNDAIAKIERALADGVHGVFLTRHEMIQLRDALRGLLSDHERMLYLERMFDQRDEAEMKTVSDPVVIEGEVVKK